MLKPHGFELDNELGGFVRRQPYGHDAMLVVNQGTAGAVGPRHFEIKFYFDVRHDCVEVPWNTLGMVYGEENQRITPTLTLHPRPRSLPSLKVIPASQDEDTSRIAQEGAALFRDKGLPFFAEFVNLSIVEALANRHPLIDLHPYNFGGPMEDRAMRSLILAKIVNPGRYAQVRETFVTLDKGMFPVSTAWPCWPRSMRWNCRGGRHRQAPREGGGGCRLNQALPMAEVVIYW